MRNFINKILLELEGQLQFINAEYESQQKRAEESYIVISKAYDKLHCIK